MFTERELIIARGARMWDSPRFEDSIMTEDIAGALLANNTSNCVIVGYFTKADEENLNANSTDCRKPNLL